MSRYQSPEETQPPFKIGDKSTSVSNKWLIWIILLAVGSPWAKDAIIPSKKEAVEMHDPECARRLLKIEERLDRIYEIIGERRITEK